MKRILGTLIALSILVTPVVASASDWAIDASHSTVGFKVRHFFTKVGGNFGEYSGTITYDPKHPEKASVEVTINAASINTNHEKRDGHLKSEDFFFVESHPEITFKSNKVEKKDDVLHVHGDLTMRGVTKPVVLKTEFLGAGPDGWGGTRAGFTATTKINRKDFGINWNKALDQGGAVLGDDVAITLDIEAVLE
ncbi:MAG: polyisoprenoid-binding protein, partial [Candidatus Eisenbacteria bacterium]|nr:polyisoprenoid-binding protein [Candidatus Eisenbacteria bacterium]